MGRFEHAHPRIRIERDIAPHSSTTYHDLLTQKLKNQDPSMDLFLMDVIWPEEFVAAGWALPLDHHFSSDERSQFLQATIQAGTYREYVYGVPSRIDSGMLYYRKDLLAQYGVSGIYISLCQKIIRWRKMLTRHSCMTGKSSGQKTASTFACNRVRRYE